VSRLPRIAPTMFEAWMSPTRQPIWRRSVCTARCRHGKVRPIRKVGTAISNNGSSP